MQKKLQSEDIVAGRYSIIEQLGKTGFSRVYSAYDLETNKKVCLKMVENKKEFFDQSIEEIKILKLVNNNGNPEKDHFVKLYDFFYCKEHLFIVTELLGYNLYEYDSLVRESNKKSYFTIKRIKTVAKQILKSLKYVHSLKLIHCDLKPENILFQSIEDCKIKLIDFGSASFLHDDPIFYMQTRPYRAPEILLGCDYDFRIDLWSLGCILLELYTGVAVFDCVSIQGNLAKMAGLMGPFPKWMLKKGRTAHKYFTKEFIPFHDLEDDMEGSFRSNTRSRLELLVPKKFDLDLILDKKRNPLFFNFIKSILNLDPYKRYKKSNILG